jgi:8-oxo-dGTP diphosphatase
VTHTKIVAKAVLFDEQSRVLLLKRSDTDELRPGEQDFPGGGVEDGEDVTDAVIREIKEETGLVVESTQLHLFYAHTELRPAPTEQPAKNVVRLVFWGKVLEPVVNLSYEHSAYDWVPAPAVYERFPHRVYGAAVEYGLDNELFAV